VLVTDDVVTFSPILVTLMVEALPSSKPRFLQEPHGITTQKTTFFIVTTVKELSGLLCSGDVICLLWGVNWDFISRNKAFFTVSRSATHDIGRNALWVI
jgi:hypothetical protein